MTLTSLFIYLLLIVGPVAAMAALMAEFLTEFRKEEPDIPPEVFASALAIIAGVIIAALGIFRIGFIVDFISGPSIAGFVSGNALSVAISQLAGLFGIPNINTRYD